MNPGYLSALPLHGKGFIKGRLEQTQEGQVVLTTSQGVIQLLSGKRRSFASSVRSRG